MESDPDNGRGLYFADSEGYIGWFQGAGPSKSDKRGGASGRHSDKNNSNNIDNDPLVDDSLLMEGIPADAIFGSDDEMDAVGSDVAAPLKFSGSGIIIRSCTCIYLSVTKVNCTLI